MRAVDCQGFAGGFTMGMVQAGFTLVGKKEMKGGFGVPNCEANRHLLGDDWVSDVGDYDKWVPIPAEVVFGNPPCSGFSLLSSKEFRGPNSPINHCMWAFEHYTARVQPLLAIFESVQQAHTIGLDLMQALRAKLEDDTSQRWWLHHVLHNNASVGGSSIRKRYFWLVSRVPFGIEQPVVSRVPTVADVLSDLEGLGDTWTQQPYRRPASWWSHPLRSPRGTVDGHAGLQTLGNRRALSLIPGTGWAQGEIISTVAQRHYEQHGKLPDIWDADKVTRLASDSWRMGFHQAHRWRTERVCRVITGAGLNLVMHPNEDRFITHREAARIQGFPDDWRIEPLCGNGGLHMTWGKGIPVHAGAWIGGWIKRAIEGNSGSYPGELTGEREYTINVTNNYRSVCAER